MRGVGGHVDGAGVGAGQAVGVEGQGDLVLLAGFEGVLTDGSEDDGVAEGNRAVGQTDVLFAVFVADAGQAEGAQKLGILVVGLVLELERAVVVEDELEVHAGVERVTVLEEADYGLVLGHLVVGAGGLGGVHRVQAPVGSDEVGVNRLVGECCGRLGPEAVVVALGEADKAGVVDVDAAVLLAVEGELEGQVDCDPVVLVVVAEGVLLGLGVGGDVDPVEGTLAVHGLAVRVGDDGVGLFGHGGVDELVTGDGVGKVLVAGVADFEGLGKGRAREDGLVKGVERELDHGGADYRAVDRHFGVAGIGCHGELVGQSALGLCGYCHEQVESQTGLEHCGELGADGHAGGAGKGGAGDVEVVAARVAYGDGDDELAGAEDAAEVDVGRGDVDGGGETFGRDDGLKAYGAYGGLRVVGDDGQVVDGGAGNHGVVDGHGGLYLYRLAGSDEAVGGSQGGDKACLGRGEAHGGARGEQAVARVVGGGLVGAPVVGHVRAGDGEDIADGGVVDAAEEGRAPLEEVLGLVVVVEHLDVTVGRQDDAERYGGVVAGVNQTEDIAEIDDKLAVGRSVLDVRVGTHLQLASPGADQACAGQAVAVRGEGLAHGLFVQGEHYAAERGDVEFVIALAVVGEAEGQADGTADVVVVGECRSQVLGADNLNGSAVLEGVVSLECRGHGVAELVQRGCAFDGLVGEGGEDVLEGVFAGVGHLEGELAGLVADGDCAGVDNGGLYGQLCGHRGGTLDEDAVAVAVIVGDGDGAGVRALGLGGEGEVNGRAGAGGEAARDYVGTGEVLARADDFVAVDVGAPRRAASRAEAAVVDLDGERLALSYQQRAEVYHLGHYHVGLVAADAEADGDGGDGAARLVGGESEVEVVCAVDELAAVGAEGNLLLLAGHDGALLGVELEEAAEVGIERACLHAPDKLLGLCLVYAALEGLGEAVPACAVVVGHVCRVALVGAGGACHGQHVALLAAREVGDYPEALAGGEVELLLEHDGVVVGEEREVYLLYQRSRRYGHVTLVDFDDGSGGRAALEALEPQRGEVEALGILFGVDTEPLSQRVGQALVGVADHRPQCLVVVDFGGIVFGVVFGLYRGCAAAGVGSGDFALVGLYVAGSGTGHALHHYLARVLRCLPLEQALGVIADGEGGGGDGGVGGGFHRQRGLVDGELGAGVGGGLLHGRQGRSLAPAVDGPDGDVVLGQGVEAVKLGRGCLAGVEELGVDHLRRQCRQVVLCGEGRLGIIYNVAVAAGRNFPLHVDVVLGCGEGEVGNRCGSGVLVHRHSLCGVEVARAEVAGDSAVAAVAVEVVDRAEQLCAQGLGGKGGRAELAEHQGGDTRHVRCSHRGALAVAVLVVRQGGEHALQLAVVEQAAGSDDVGLGAVARVGGGGELGGHGRNGDAGLVRCGVEVAGLAGVAHGEDAEAAGHARSAGLFGEVVDGVEDGLLVVARAVPAPRALRDAGAVLAGVDEGLGKVALAGAAARVKDLARHQAHARLYRAVAAGHAGHADAVVVDGGYGAGHVGAVVVGINLAFVGAEVVAVDIVDITVAVIVLAGLAVELGQVDVEVLAQVLVAGVDTAVDDGDDNVGRAGRDLPGVKEVDVGSGDAVGYVAEVLVVPLERHLRVVPRHSRGCGTRGGVAFEQAEGSAALLQRHRCHCLGALYARRCGKHLAGLFGADVTVEADGVPAVEAVFGALCGILGRRWQHRFDAHRSHQFYSVVERRGAGLQHAVDSLAGLCPQLGRHLGLQLDAYHALGGRDSRKRSKVQSHSY